MPLSAGDEIGNYVLIKPLARGGMGEVWAARHKLLDRSSALKVIRSRSMADSGQGAAVLTRRFAREAQAMSQLTSPHTVRVFDFGTIEDGSFYYAMELLDGIDFRTLVERHGPVAPERAVRFMIQAGESLAEAHRAGFVHRDIKPANLFACRAGIHVDVVKVLDFGLVKSVEGVRDETQLTSEGAATGSPAFMAPEIVLGENIDARTDIYALGCVGFWLLTGRLVFDERIAMRMIMAHVDRPARRPSEATSLPIPGALDDLIVACLAKDPDARPPSADAVAMELASLDLASLWTPERAREWWACHLPGPEPDDDASRGLGGVVAAPDTAASGDASAAVEDDRAVVASLPAIWTSPVETRGYAPPDASVRAPASTPPRAPDETREYGGDGAKQQRAPKPPSGESRWAALEDPRTGREAPRPDRSARSSARRGPRAPDETQDFGPEEAGPEPARSDRAQPRSARKAKGPRGLDETQDYGREVQPPPKETRDYRRGDATRDRRASKKAPPPLDETHDYGPGDAQRRRPAPSPAEPDAPPPSSSPRPLLDAINERLRKARSERDRS